MVLYLDRTEQPSDNRTMEFPIYELDFDKLKGFTNLTYGGSQAGSLGTPMEQNGGYLKDVNPNNVDPCYFTVFTATDSRILQCLSTNVPRQAWMDGSLIRYKISPQVEDEYTIYKLNPDYIEFDKVEGEQPPDDWADNFWYYQETIQSFNYQNVSYQYYAYTPHIPASSGYDQNKTWVKDKDHKLGAKIFTANGYSFGWFWYPYTTGARSKIGSSSSNYQFFAWKSAGDDYIRPGSDSLDPPFVSSSYLDGFTPFTRTSASEKTQMLVGDTSSLYNYTPFFVNFNIGGTPFYGIAITHSDSYGETANPNQITVIAFTPNFWGGSIQPGGPDPGIWGNDGPTSQAQGGGGTWSAPSNNHGDNNGTTASQVGAIWGGNHSIFDIGYKKYILGSPDATAFGQMVGKLSNPEDWGTGFTNKYYNPIQAIISCHMIPANLAPVHTGSDKIVAATVNLTDVNVPTFSTLYYTKHIGSVNLAEYTGSFADYNNTSIYINLPYIGVKQLDTAACMNGQIAVDYLIDYLTGDTTAWVWVQDRFGNHNIRYEWKGNIARPIPLTQRVPASTQFMSSMLPAVATAAGSLAVGGLVGAVGGAGSMLSWGLGEYGSVGEFLKGGVQGAISGFGEGINRAAGLLTKGGIGSMGIGAAVGSALNAGQQMTSSNANGGSVSSPVNTQCYLSISRPQWSAPGDYRMHFGYPSDVSGTINEKFEGFLSVRDIKLENIHATAEEKAEITSLMAAGVYVSDNFNPPQ